MKTKFNIIFLIFFPLSIFGQGELTEEQILEDFTIFKEILTIGHPSLYEYTPKVVWDSIFNSFEQKGVKEAQTPNDLFKSITSIAENVKDGHLNILHPKIDTLTTMFPVLIKIIDGKFYKKLSKK